MIIFSYSFSLCQLPCFSPCFPPRTAISSLCLLLPLGLSYAKATIIKFHFSSLITFTSHQIPTSLHPFLRFLSTEKKGFLLHLHTISFVSVPILMFYPFLYIHPLCNFQLLYNTYVPSVLLTTYVGLPFVICISL